jgi:hypothetical protein
MGFYPSGSGEHGRATVLADLQDSTETWDHDGDGERVDPAPTPVVNAIRYVASTTNFEGTDYVAAASEFNAQTHDDALPTGTPTKTEAGARPDYLGYFGFVANDEVTLTFTVVCWFEGTDPEIVNRATTAEYQSVAASLHFEAIKLAD